MSAKEDSENSKKRKKDELGSNAVEASPIKTSKLEYSLDGKRFFNDDDSMTSDSSQGSSSSDYVSQASTSHLEGESQNNTQSESHSYQLQEDKDKNEWILELQSKQIYNTLLEVFSKENLPRKIKYTENDSNVTKVYKKFWTSFYNSPICSRGHGVKLPQVKSLTEIQVRSIAQIIRRGWEDEHYWPVTLCRPFLQSCLFPDMHPSKILMTPDIFLEFIEPSEKALIQSLNTVNEDVYNIFKKYSAENVTSVGEDVFDCCKKAASEIMVTKMKPIIEIWSEHLNGLMPLKEFNSVMKPKLLKKIDQKKPEVPQIDMDGNVPPHEKWDTFFLDWPEDKIVFYFRLLNNGKFGESCNHCGDRPFNAKHFLCCCNRTLETLRLERHDCILRKLERITREAIKRNSPYFSEGAEWEMIIMYGNERYKWPENLGVSFDNEFYPHMLVYTTSPKKKLLLVEFSISWEYWIDMAKDGKSQRYLRVKKQLEDVGFEVKYEVFALGSRGVITHELEKICLEVFGMNHSSTSKALEEISKEILRIHYSAYKLLTKTLDS